MQIHFQARVRLAAARRCCCPEFSRTCKCHIGFEECSRCWPLHKRSVSQLTDHEVFGLSERGKQATLPVQAADCVLAGNYTHGCQRWTLPVQHCIIAKETVDDTGQAGDTLGPTGNNTKDPRSNALKPPFTTVPSPLLPHVCNHHGAERSMVAGICLSCLHRRCLQNANKDCRRATYRKPSHTSRRSAPASCSPTDGLRWSPPDQP